MISHLAWIGGSLGGALFGQLIGHEWMGFPFALVAFFISLLVLQIESLHFFFGAMILAGIFSVFVKADQREQQGGRKKKRERNLNSKGSYVFYGFCPPLFWIIGIVIQDLCQKSQRSSLLFQQKLLNIM
jgi:hypothetical protein